MNYIKFIFSIILFSFLNCNCFANPINSSLEQEFNLVSSHEEFDKIIKRFENSKIKILTVSKQIDKLNELETITDKCLETGSKKLVIINKQINQFFGAAEFKTTDNVDANYLKQQKEIISKKIAECRLFKIRIEELRDNANALLLTKQQEETFTSQKDLVARVKTLPKDLSNYQIPEANYESVFFTHKQWLYIIIALAFGLFISYQIKKFFHKDLINPQKLFILNTLFVAISSYALTIYTFNMEPFDRLAPNFYFQSLMLCISMCTLCFFIINFIFSIPKVVNFLSVHNLNHGILKKIAEIILFLYFIRLIGINFLNLYDFPTNIIQLFENIMLIIDLGMMLYLVKDFYNFNKDSYKLKHPQLIFQCLLILSLGIILLSLSGYLNLAIEMAHLLFSTMLVLAIGMFAFLILNKLYLLCSTYPMYDFLKNNFGYNAKPPFLELKIIKILLQIFIIVVLLKIFAYFTPHAGIYINYANKAIIQGFTIATVNIILFQWFLALFLFCILFLVSRYIATKISLKKQFDEGSTQVPMATIVLYIGFAISVIIALGMSGFSFTSLAIIAGALSVGIGLGLQSIVNNFISGLILLIEKPIRIGDRIVVDNAEGYVRRISLRSTQLETPSHEDIIIPNSDLITHQVKNFTSSNINHKIQIKVAVPFGSDIETIREILLEVLINHPEVIANDDKPEILFLYIQDAAIILEANCLIRNINKKSSVTSDLNFAIVKTLSEHNIKIAYPTRNLNVKLDSQISTPTEDKN